MKAALSDYPLHGPRMLDEPEQLQSEFYDDGNFVTRSPEMLRILEIARRVANTEVPVFLLGESGVGKDMVARFIHNQSDRFGNPFVRVNCAAVPHELMESELFGFEKGAFTGALYDRPGKFQQANKGTLFLDEIAETSPHLQAKLLHVLQDGEFSRLGSRCSSKVDVRVIAATNCQLRQALIRGDFRNDLYFRLNVIQIQIPSLRDRREDIPLLASHFLQKYRERYGCLLQTLPQPVMNELIHQQWPGNVRQLENAVRRYLILNATGLEPDDTSNPDVIAPTNSVNLSLLGKRAADQVERDIVLRALRDTGWNRKACAKRVHISYKALRNRLKKWGINGNPGFNSPLDGAQALDQLD